ncbi:hypothetical protein [Vibrio sp. Hep-1b-8]|uniref:hypothetical protein n=1 Tax=Vibrio sp. Hep-1b-8 TaxID=2144187 RepID=UPI001110EB3F|nr:hypothetical protein [Vibrio sp. Hep-1b-8]TMX30603.1 hypothetical protein DA100_20930 [Vibrio sp. Hep-1b-8]
MITARYDRQTDHSKWLENVRDLTLLGMAICKDIATLHNTSIELLPRKDDCNEFIVRCSANQ